MSDWSQFSRTPPAAAPAASDPWAKFRKAEGGGATEKPIEEGFWSYVDDFGDLLASTGSGLLSGVEGIPGLPGDVEQLGRSVYSMATDTKPTESLLPTSERIGKFVQEETGIGPYKPRTTLGKYLQTVAEFVPGAAIGGGAGGMARNLIRYGVIPGVVSETAGELTKDTPLETAARIAGGLLGAGGAQALDRTAGVAARSIDELEQQAGQLYKQVDQSGLRIRPQSFWTGVTDMVLDAHNEGYLPGLHPKATAAMRHIVETADQANKTGIPLSFSEIDRLRRVARAVGKSLEPDERRIGHVLVDSIDSWMNQIGPRDVHGHGLNATVQASQDLAKLKQARLLWQQRSKGQVIERILDRAGLRADANYTSAGIQTALKQEFKNLANNQKLMRTFSLDERAAIRNVVRTGSTEWVTRLIGKLAIRGQMSLLGTALTFGPAGMIVGELAKKISTNITRSKAEDVSELVRGGTPGRMRTAQYNVGGRVIRGPQPAAIAGPLSGAAGYLANQPHPLAGSRGHGKSPVHGAVYMNQGGYRGWYVKQPNGQLRRVDLQGEELVPPPAPAYAGVRR